MPVFWSVNKQIRTDTVFHVIICAKHGTSTRAAAPRAAKIWPPPEIFWPEKMTRWPRAPCRFCRSPVAGSRPSNHCPATSGNVRQRMVQRPRCAVRQRPVFFRRSPVALAGRVFERVRFQTRARSIHVARCALTGTFGLGRGRRAAARLTEIFFTKK